MIVELSPTRHATAPSASERIRPLMPAGISQLIPDTILEARIGKGTVASEFDRALRVRIEGDGPPSSRAIVAETTTAQRVLESKAGPAFRQLIHATLASADAARGNDDLRTFTFLPDEHAAKAVEFLSWLQDWARTSGEKVTFSTAGTEHAERQATQFKANQIAREVAGEIAFLAGRNSNGNISISPDDSRRVLATIGAYRMQPGDPFTKQSPETREWRLRDDFDTLVHETQHSVSPLRWSSASQEAKTFEEATAVVLSSRARTRAIHRAGAKLEQVAARPSRSRDDAGLEWPAWSRDHLPKPPASRAATAASFYVDGPAVVRRLLSVAGFDMRRNADFDAAFDLLQGTSAEAVPRRLADAIIERLNVDPSHRERLVDRVRRSVLHKDGARHVTDLLAELGALPAPR